MAGPGRRLQGRRLPPGEVPEAWPEIPTTLLERLETLYPPRCMGPGESDRDHLFYAGAQNLVSTLRAIHDNQNGEDAEDMPDSKTIEAAISRILGEA